MKRIAIFASGSGSNMQKIAEYFSKSTSIEITLVLCNNPEAYVLERADNLEIPSMVFSKQELYQSTEVLDALHKCKIDFIVLAGFLWLMPSNILSEYANRVVNLHPALLPKYGGKGMYGNKVHAAVKAAGETQTGITIHYVNEQYDEGQIIFQKATELSKNDSIDDIAFKVHQLEHHYFPKVIEDLVRKV